jgi:hypothetical protein
VKTPVSTPAPRNKRLIFCTVLIVGAAFGPLVRADATASPPVPTKRQMMKVCMAKQKASDAGMTKEQMKKNCKDVTETEQENAKTDRDNGDRPGGTPRP